MQFWRRDFAKRDNGIVWFPVTVEEIKDGLASVTLETTSYHIGLMVAVDFLVQKKPWWKPWNKLGEGA